MDADLVKLYFPSLELPTLRAITAEAKKHKLKVAGHKPGNLTVREFVEAGVNEIQHARWYLIPGASLMEPQIAREFAERRDSGKPLTSNEMYSRLLADYNPAQADAMIELFVKNDTWITPTLGVSIALGGLGLSNYSDDPRRKYIPDLIWKSWDIGDGRRKAPNEETRELIGKLNARAAGFIPLLRDAGVPILAGSDAGYSNNFVFPGWSLHEELSLLRDAGLTNAEALQTATISAARFFKETKRHGSIGKGKAADLVLLDANPLVDIRNTRKIAGVMRQGRWFDRKALDQMLNDLAKQ
jgi:imidazolonepropionase-like amidohydrolase